MIDTILQHKTVRKYTNDKINDADLEAILEAGIRASTTGNMQLYSIIVTRDQEMKEKLAPSHFNQPMVTKAPVVLTFCADFNRFNKWCEARNAKPGYDNFLSFYTASVDAMLVAQNVALAAEEKGLGICYLGTTNYMAQQIIDTLNLPKGVVPVTTITLGVPDEEPELTDRLPLDGVIHFEEYSDYSAEQIDRIYEEKEELPSSKKLIEENGKETLAQIFTDNRYTKENNITFSKALLSVLEKQGFMNQ
ncbi:MAG: NADPH-dependent oxidoreductase [Ichthyobacteriaceae bacterium]|nr:NADPH-dependent oxidoreductase [Ichthyobacteriaceae bacterium]